MVRPFRTAGSRVEFHGYRLAQGDVARDVGPFTADGREVCSADRPGACLGTFRRSRAIYGEVKLLDASSRRRRGLRIDQAPSPTTSGWFAPKTRAGMAKSVT